VDGKLQTRAHQKHPGERTGSSVAVCTHWLSNKGWPILVVVAIIQACCEPTADRKGEKAAKGISLKLKRFGVLF
jgi:hypothetical protein